MNLYAWGCSRSTINRFERLLARDPVLHACVHAIESARPAQLLDVLVQTICEMAEDRARLVAHLVELENERTIVQVTP